MKQVTDASFEADVLKAKGLVLVDFWATWCGPCKQLAPTLDDLAAELGDKLTIAKVDIDRNPATPAKYSVRGVPALMLFKDGSVVDTTVGNQPKSRLMSWLSPHL